MSAPSPNRAPSIDAPAPSAPGQRPRDGVLLINLGTPQAPQAGAVRRYLREFLSDPRVIDIPALPRWLLVHGIIAPFRAPRSAAAYRTIWGPAGSPLLTNGRALEAALAERLRDRPVALGMRYGQPSLASALERLLEQGVERVLAVPLYPQYASSSTGSSVERLYRLASERWNTPWIEVLPPFFDAPEFLEAVADVARPALEAFRPDHVLLSYHGLPERHVKKSDPTGAHCLAQADCCERPCEANRWCYRAQCFATSRGLAARLGLPAERLSTAFQSRLGRDPWIRPFTDERVLELARAGVKRLAVLCPSFTADCLETLEEIGGRAREEFLAHGGEALELVPCVNAAPAWVAGLAALIEARLAPR